MKIPSIYILSTGTELSVGRSRDSNGPFLARKCTEAGWSVFGMGILPDDENALFAEIERLLTGNGIDVLIMTGGLGPTEDDRTIDALSRLTDREIEEDPEALLRITKIVERVNKRFRLQDVRRQTRTLKGARVLNNSVGLAPGLLVEYPRQGKTPAFLAALPGVPQEMETMLEAELLPALQERFPAKASERAEFYLYGVGETNFQTDFFSGTEDSDLSLSPDFRWGVAAQRGFIKVFLESSSEQEIRLLHERARNMFSSAYLEAPALVELHEHCLASGATIATAESCTGGWIGKMLTDASGSSNYYRGGVIAYSNDVKTATLGVSPDTIAREGAVSETCAREMAEGARRVLQADFALSITGIAGPGGGSEEKPVGTVWMACAGKDRETHSWKFFYPLDRDRVREYSANLALFGLYRFITEG